MNAVLFMVALLGLIPGVEDLSKTGMVANEHQKPILLYVSRSDCTFCRRFEKEQLGPLLNSGLYQDKIIFRELVWDTQGAIINFRGERVSRSTFAQSWNAKLTPTLLFLNGLGNEIVPGIRGYNANDYFGYYLEAALKKAITRAQSLPVLQHSEKGN